MRYCFRRSWGTSLPLGARLLAIAALVAVLSVPVASRALSMGGIGIRPLNPSGSEPGWFIYTLEPGATREDTVLVFNNSDREQALEVTSVDSELSNIGAFALRGNQEPQYGVGKWITLAEQVVTLQAGERREVKFTITLPPDADVGEHSGAITVTAARTAASASSGGVTIATRVGARVYVTVPGKQVHKLSLRSLAVAETADGTAYDFTLVGANEGNISLTTDARLHLEGFGLAKWNQPFREYEIPQQWQLLRGAEVSTYFRNVPKPFAGRLTAYVTLTYDGDSGPESVTSQRLTLTVIPWREAAIAGGVLVLLLALLATWMLLRRRKYSSKGWVAYPAAVGDTITALAVAGGVDWRVLAKVNRLKPPYVLTSGQVLKVPPTAVKRSDAAAKPAPAEVPGPVDESAQVSPPPPPPAARRWVWGILFVVSGVLVAVALLLFVRSASQLPSLNSAFDLATTTVETLEPLPPAPTTTSTGTVPLLPQADPGTATVAPTSTPPVDPAALQSVRVLVLNGSGVAGQAGGIAEQLRAAGFTRVETANADSFTYQGLLIRHHPGQEPAAQAVAAALRAGALSESTDAPAPVVVIVGGPQKDAPAP